MVTSGGSVNQTLIKKGIYPMALKKVRKEIARRVYNNGKPVSVIPCNVSPLAFDEKFAWIQPVTLIKDENDTTLNQFERLINSYIHYNCNSVTGYYPHYYVNEKDI